MIKSVDLLKRKVNFLRPSLKESEGKTKPSSKKTQSSLHLVS